MLEFAVLRQNSLNGVFDVGQLLDVLLYYGKVHLVLDSSAFFSLLQQLGPVQLRRLLEFENVSTDVAPEDLGVLSRQLGVNRTYQPGFYRIGGQGGRQSAVDIFADRSRRIPGLRAPSRDLIDRLLRKTRKSDFGRILGNYDQFNALFRSLAADEATLKLAVQQTALARTGRNVPDAVLQALRVDVSTIDQSIVIQSNIPIESIIPPESKEDQVWGNVLTRLQDYTIDLLLSQIHSADLIVAPEVEEIAAARIDLSLQRGQHSSAQISNFTEFTLQGVRYWELATKKVELPSVKASRS